MRFLSFFSLNVIWKRQESERMDVAFCDLQLVAFLRVKNRSPLSLVIKLLLAVINNKHAVNGLP